MLSINIPRKQLAYASLQINAWQKSSIEAATFLSPIWRLTRGYATTRVKARGWKTICISSGPTMRRASGLPFTEICPSYNKKAEPRQIDPQVKDLRFSSGHFKYG